MLGDRYIRPDRSKNELRIVILKSGQDSERICCALALTQLVNPADYTALSYTWGLTDDHSLEPPKSIITLDTGAGEVLDFQVSANLFSALKALRKPDEDFRLWIDAICINQDPASEEKAVMVPMMDQIYRNAKGTIIWLGEESDDSALAMTTMANLQASDFEASDLNPRDEHWTALRKLLRRRWWSRLWVLQEALLSRSPIVQCGSHTVPLQKFIDICIAEDANKMEHIARFGSLQLFNFGVPVSECFLTWARDKSFIDAGGHGILLGDWYSWTKRLGCVEPLDRVYALLGLVEPQEKEVVLVDYDAEPGKIFTQSAQRSFEYYGLNMMHHGYSTERAEWRGIPSWVPDWEDTEELVPLSKWTPIENDGPRSQHSSQTIPVSLRSHVFWTVPTMAQWSRTNGVLLGPARTCVVDAEKQELGVMGLIVDNIKYHSSHPTIPSYGGLDLEEYDAVRHRREDSTVAACQAWEAHVDTLTSTVYDNSEGGRYEAFWRTLIMDRTFGWEARAPASYAELFEIWIRRSLADLDQKERKKAMFSYYAPAISRLATRAFTVTSGGYFALVPGKARVGDRIVFLRGGTVPFVVRVTSRQGEERFEFVGDCYVHGIMHGELLTEDRVKDVREFWLV